MKFRYSNHRTRYLPDIKAKTDATVWWKLTEKAKQARMPTATPIMLPMRRA